jgi:3-deoxy-manno-octulosonate cytidylyltransferase (CMP-KDO synthetase)
VTEVVRVLGVIPTRMASVRFPGKPLATLVGRPLVRWVYEAASACPTLDYLVVATPDPEIFDVVRSFGGDAVLTSLDHLTGTDRVAEVATMSDADIVVNVQGDQPFVTAAMIDGLVAPFSAGGTSHVVMTTLGAPLAPSDQANGNAVKVVCDRNSDALYFSRSPIPFYRTAGWAPVFHHIGLYAYSAPFLELYQAMTPTPLEQCEGLEQLRALEYGYRIRVSRIEQTSVPTIEVNTPEDLVDAEAYLVSQNTI